MGGEGLAGLSWLAGCWSSETAEPGSGEHWMPPAGGTMLGVGRTVRDGRTVAHELLQIRETPDGGLVLIALPSGQAEATFRLLHMAEGEVLFENPEHDFPHRVMYRLQGADRLLGRIEGTEGGKLRGVDFPMRRVDCEAAVAPPGE